MAKTKSRSPSSADDLAIVHTSAEYYNEAYEARITRLKKNRLNWDIYYGNQDWSHKQDGQSTEFLPKMANSAEQMSAFIRKSLTAFGDWFSVETPQQSPLTPEQIRTLMRRFLDNVVVRRGKTAKFSTIIGDGVKQALMESLLIFKVHGEYLTEKSFKVEPGIPLAGIEPKLNEQADDVWRLRIDLISAEDYLPDPTGRGLYECHLVERDLYDVLKLSEGQGAIYDPKVVETIKGDFVRDERLRLRPRHRGQNLATPPSRRHRVQLEEWWGTILGPDGHPLHENVVWTIANKKYLIRKPTPNPFWHRESPIIAEPVIRVPHSVWHKALYDHVAQLNIALNELFNLILDGGIGAVWGVRQVREDWLADPRQISNGIPQGATLLVNEDAPADAEVVKTVSTSKVPQESMMVQQQLDREIQQAGLTNDIRLGNLPQRQVKATELNMAESNSSVLLDAFAGDLEGGVITKILEKSWLTMLQFMDDIPAQDVVDAIGVSAAFRLSKMSPAERYAMFAVGMKFKVNGLSATLAKAKDFQKLMALQQGIAQNPILTEAFVRRMSPDKTLDHLMRSLNINPESLEMTEDERNQGPQRLKNMQQLQGVMPQQGGTPSAPAGGGDQMTGMRETIGQDNAPTGGLSS